MRVSTVLDWNENKHHSLGVGSGQKRLTLRITFNLMYLKK